MSSARTPSGPSGPSARPDRSRRAAAWRDPRLAVGVLLVAGSVVLGAVVLGGEDPGTPVWQLRTGAAAGTVLDPEDLVTVRVSLPGERASGAYVPATTPLPADTVLRRGVAAGELLPSAALEADGPTQVQVPVPTSESGVPGTVRPGSTVDVWVSPAAPGTGAPRATRVLEDVTVVSLPSSAALGGAAPRPLVVGFDPGAVGDLGQVLAQLAEGTAVVVGRA